MDIERLVGPIYGYCLKRLKNTFDAQDLAQEILLEIFAALPRSDVRDPDAWVWRIAHNRYARFLNGKHRGWLSVDDSYADERHIDADNEAADSAFNALHAISAGHREILVDHYVRGLSCGEIAVRRGMSCSTVRTRLHYGRDKLRKKWGMSMETSRVYDKFDWHVFGNGDIDISYLERQLPRAILSVCRTEYKTIEDISEATGIPCMYIEDELAGLVRGEIVYRKGNRYISGVILYKDGYIGKVNEILTAAAPDIAAALSEAIDGSIGRVRAIGFRGCDAAVEKMRWWLTPVMLRAACDRARKCIGFERGEFYPRGDGGKGWLVAYENEAGARRYYAGCNNYYLEGSRFRYYWTDKYLDTAMAGILRRLESGSVLQDEELAAECIRMGIAVVEGGRATLTLPLFSEGQFEQLSALAADCADGLARRLIPTAERLLTLMKDSAPKHLHGQLRGLFGIDFNAIIAVVCDIMETEGLLAAPGTGAFAGQIIQIG